MKKIIFSALLLALGIVEGFSQDSLSKKESGKLQLGLRSVTSAFSDDGASGMGVGGQFRLKFGSRLNSDWFLDYITTDIGVAYYLDRLKRTPDGDGSLLDHSALLYGSGIGNPNVHDHTDLPIIVAGGGFAGLKHGRHIRYEQATPLANLHLTLLDKIGVQIDSFADSNGRAHELFTPLSV